MSLRDQKKPKVLLLHPGTQYSFYLAEQLSKSGLLYKFCTGIVFSKNSWSGKLAQLFPFLKNRVIEGVDEHALKRYPFPELTALYRIRKGKSAEDVFYKRNEAFQRTIPDKLIRSADIVIGFDTASWIIADRCRQLKKVFILDVSIAHPDSKEKTFESLSILYPEWAQQLQPKKKFMIDTERREMELADHITVPSRFVKQTYIDNGILANKITVNPFGTDINFFTYHKRKPCEKIHFLFFGSLTARKGLPILLEAWKELNLPSALLLLAGYGKVPISVTLPANTKYLGPIPKDKRQWLFEQADVFVFPSYHEGLAQVQIEAAASGLPLIGTINSGAEEIIEEGRNGFILQPQDKEELKKAILYFVNNKDKIPDMGFHSRQISENFTWDNYGKRWEKLLYAVFENSHSK